MDNFSGYKVFCQLFIRERVCFGFVGKFYLLGLFLVVFQFIQVLRFMRVLFFLLRRVFVFIEGGVFFYRFLDFLYVFRVMDIIFFSYVILVFLRMLYYIIFVGRIFLLRQKRQGTVFTRFWMQAFRRRLEQWLFIFFSRRRIRWVFLKGRRIQ